ncbi:hypothetical protein ACFPYJ_31195 [Paenibacillus solisilvae]|uniref:Uncharacterized protein n=1 Tax=Paenibacillus solisilvae TaxID=2486751 RepID=A0ABW0W7U3_9BACL
MKFIKWFVSAFVGVSLLVSAQSAFAASPAVTSSPWTNANGLGPYGFSTVSATQYFKWTNNTGSLKWVSVYSLQPNGARIELEVKLPKGSVVVKPPINKGDRLLTLPYGAVAPGETIYWRIFFEGGPTQKTIWTYMRY